MPSDIEQMPNLLNFLKDNGTLETNDHTILISHTGGGILSTLTGLYPDRHGQAVSNSYNYFRAGRHQSASRPAFKYWTDNTDGGNPANSPPTPSADTELQHGQHRPGLARRHRRGAQRAGAVGALHARRLRRRQRRASRTQCSRTTTRSSSGHAGAHDPRGCRRRRRHEHQGRQRRRLRRRADDHASNRRRDRRDRVDRRTSGPPVPPARASTSRRRSTKAHASGGAVYGPTRRTRPAT